MFHFKQVVRIIAIHALMLLGTATAWAGRGDVDPNYGDGGRVSIPPSVLLALPGDRLVIADSGTTAGFRVRMVDATGRNVPTFGDGGVVVIASAAGARTFSPEAAALAPNGDMIFLGSLVVTQVQVLLRLDADGQPIRSFGNRGDGFVEAAPTAKRAKSFATDPGGKIVFGEGRRNPDGSCTARLQRLLANGHPDAEFGSDGLSEIPNLNLCNGDAIVFGARADSGVIVGDSHTIVAVDASGNIDPTFGAEGRLTVTELAQVRGLLLPDGGLLIFGSSDESASSSDTVLLKFDRNGQPDLAFGPGTGSLTVDLGTEFFDEPFTREHVDQLAFDPDGKNIVAHLSVSRADGRFVCRGIVRLSIDGTPDSGFGRNGLVCLNVDFSLIAVQGDGAPLFFTEDDVSIHRLLPDNSPSPGFLKVVGKSATVGESEDTASVAIARLAGRDGAVSAYYATVNGRTYSSYPHRLERATPGSDYIATSGQLDWASGDDGQRTITISILNDHIFEPWENFGVDFSEPPGGIQLIWAGWYYVNIDDDDEVSSTPPPTPPPTVPPGDPPTTIGGGGSVSWATLALLTLLLIDRRRLRRAD
jgi:uncharacterized delta-60 repeat protein